MVLDEDVFSTVVRAGLLVYIGEGDTEVMAGLCAIVILVVYTGEGDVEAMAGIVEVLSVSLKIVTVAYIDAPQSSL